MAASRSALAPAVLLALVAAAALWHAPAFVAPQSSLRGAVAAVPAALLPAVAQAAEQVEMPDLGSSVSTAGLYEPLLLGICLGLFPTTLLGLFVAAWLQFKKGPTLGLERLKAPEGLRAWQLAKYPLCLESRSLKRAVVKNALAGVVRLHALAPKKK
eukprot:CAMPEP_0170590254 /NCGR_PEP_ID=MMETSP0224-20130122/11772_1 /TAXON_ID=285029 /ORGANISM="Togula jolla, Strain CCCM 725" /LENGTH=156 /DNA_ID=CAMNT_0010914039 /DNA_START=57 /DNA_END=525 /DNA_ORIENTATION=+